MNVTSWSDSRATTTTPTAPGSTPTCTWHWSGLASISLEAKQDRAKRPFFFFQCLPNANLGMGNIYALTPETKKEMWRQWRQRAPSTLPKIAVMLSDCYVPFSFISVFFEWEFKYEVIRDAEEHELVKAKQYKLEYDMQGIYFWRDTKLCLEKSLHYIYSNLTYYFSTTLQKTFPELLNILFSGKTELHRGLCKKSKCWIALKKKKQDCYKNSHQAAFKIKLLVKKHHLLPVKLQQDFKQHHETWNQQQTATCAQAVDYKYGRQKKALCWVHTRQE